MRSVEEEPIAAIVSGFAERIRDEVRSSDVSIAESAGGAAQLEGRGSAVASANAGLLEADTMASTAASRLRAGITVIEARVEWLPRACRRGTRKPWQQGRPVRP